MFHDSVYVERRNALRERLRGGIALFIGNVDSPINFPHNVHPFRQDATFTYFFGVNSPGLAAFIDVDSGDEVVFGDEVTLDDEIWLGKTRSLAESFARAGCKVVKPYADLSRTVREAILADRAVHFLPAYRAETVCELSRILGCEVADVPARASSELIRAVISLREIKSELEIEEIESALLVTGEMHRAAMRATRPGAVEREVVAEMRRVLGRRGLHEAYQPVFTKRGEILHNFDYGLTLERGDLVVNDSGAASARGYSSDVTRTLPVSGRFNPKQRELYELMLDVQQQSIAAVRPGVSFMAVHRLAALRMVQGMSGLGLFKGDPLDVVDSGAYAICLPHGLGHQLGLDVHDMESFGEDHVGYDDDIRRSALFGLANLRLGKSLKAGMVITVEPGIYFVPALIERWAAEQRHHSFIDYRRFDEYMDFGGMRIEDEVLVTATSHRVMGPGIPKTVQDVELAMEA